MPKKSKQVDYFLVLVRLFDYLQARSLARFRCVSKIIKEKIAEEQIVELPVYIDLIESLQTLVKTKTHPSASGMYTVDTDNGWMMRASFINNGHRIRIDFQSPLIQRWFAFGKFKPENFKQIMYRAIDKERQMVFGDTTVSIESILTNISSANMIMSYSSDDSSDDDSSDQDE